MNPAAQPRKELPPQANVWSHQSLFTPSARYLALFSVAASFVLPFQGFGFDICPLHRFTGLPCPGCGMTRAFVLFSSGDPLAAFGANPGVLFFYPVFWLLALVTLLPACAFAAVEQIVSARARAVGQVYRLVLFAFVAFGMARLVFFFSLGERFP